MSIIRTSLVKTTMHAVMPDGAFSAARYARRSPYRGVLGDFSQPPDDAPTDDYRKALARHGARLDRFIEPMIGLHGADLGPGQPVCVLVHGFQFDPTQDVALPRSEANNPHRRLYHFDWAQKDSGFIDIAERDAEIRHHTTGWPRALGFGPDDRGALGLAWGFGWYSNPGFIGSLVGAGQNFYVRAYSYARQAAWSLICVLDGLARHVSDRPIDIFCHSLGSAVVIRAMAIAAKHRLSVVPRIGRIVILGGSEYTAEGNLMHRRVNDALSDMGLQRAAEPCVYNIVSVENLVLDLFAENAGPRGVFTNTQVVGHNGLEAGRADRWIDLQIDSGDLRAWLRKNKKLHISGDNPETVWDHWYYYTWPGNMMLYRAFLRDRADWSISALRKESGFPEGVR